MEAPRALAASLALEPGWPPEAWGPLPLVAGMAACQAIGGEVGLKWPNDLIAGGRKVGGVLVEAAGSLVVTGLGLNLWWPDPPEGIGAVFEDDPGEAAARSLAEGWAESFLDRLGRPPGEWSRDEYRAMSVTIGTDIAWDPAGAGRAVDVAEDGALVVEAGGGLVTLRSGEVRNVGRGPANRG
jgi:BirA family biotin operon repressor/biotin-[acetyl-CoA-carboxylase] ligase